jgi:hypothetical protein
LRPNIVITQQVKLEQRWKRPNHDGGEKGEVSARNAGPASARRPRRGRR